MQVEYKKEWMDTYLWVLPENRVEESYVEHMLFHNQGEGRLDFSRQEKDGEEYYCYKVTGKKALNSIYAVLPIGERQIRSILKQLFETLESGREYLLCEEDFVLAPNYIFATFPQMELEFCYVPGYGVPLREQLEGLFEYLLNRVDYEDKSAVNLLYDCYMFCMKEKGGLAEIKKRLEKDGTPGGQENKEMIQLVEEQKTAMQVKQIQVPQQAQACQTVHQISSPEPEPVSEKKTSSGSYVSWLTGRLFRRSKREVSLVAEEREEYRAESGMIKRKDAVSEGASEEYDRTVLLAAKVRPSVPELICEQTGEVVAVTKVPFFIGSTPEFVDYVAIGEGISRIHCCINKKEDRYYLSDLNSTNGTYLNHQEVNPGREVLLSTNDEIRIASQEFYVKFPCH